MSDKLWFVAHTRPRCEKKVAEFCRRQGISVTLPCLTKRHRYRGKVAAFEVPLFSGYVFLEMDDTARQLISRNRYIANLLYPEDQKEFETQLKDILLALES